MNAVTLDHYNRHVAASERLLTDNGNQTAHATRLSALHDYFAGSGRLDADTPQHVRDWFRSRGLI